MISILIAEDDRDLSKFLRDELTDVGFSVSLVTNGAEAVVRASEEHFDVFVLDMLMPGLDGIQATKVLRKVAPGVPIVGLTGYVGHGYMAQAAALDMVCLAKPVVVTDLLREIEEALRFKAKRSVI